KNNIPKDIYVLDITPNDIPLIGLYWNKKEDRDYSDSYLPIDIIGSAFFMLTRWEEDFVDIRDKHGRCLANDCVAFKFGFLQIPVVDYYVNLLEWILTEKGEQIIARKDEYCIIPTHDID